MHDANTPHAMPMDDARLQAEKKFNNGTSWFFWVAGLSLINSVIVLFGGSWSFLFGLGITQLVDAVAFAFTEEGGGGVFKFMGFAVNLVIAGAVVGMGILARQRRQWALVLGMVLYALDGALLLFVQDFLGLAFHGWVLFSFFGAYVAGRSLGEMDQRQQAPQYRRAS